MYSTPTVVASATDLGRTWPRHRSILKTNSTGRSALRAVWSAVDRIAARSALLVSLPLGLATARRHKANTTSCRLSTLLATAPQPCVQCLLNRWMVRGPCGTSTLHAQTTRYPSRSVAVLGSHSIDQSFALRFSSHRLCTMGFPSSAVACTIAVEERFASNGRYMRRQHCHAPASAFALTWRVERCIFVAGAHENTSF